jgi:hypothetical protein
VKKKDRKGIPHEKRNFIYTINRGGFGAISYHFCFIIYVEAAATYSADIWCSIY